MYVLLTWHGRIWAGYQTVHVLPFLVSTAVLPQRELNEVNGKLEKLEESYKDKIETWLPPSAFLTSHGFSL